MKTLKTIEKDFKEYKTIFCPKDLDKFLMEHLEATLESTMRAMRKRIEKKKPS